MTDTDTDTNPRPAKAKPAKPADITLVVGSNQGEARRAADALGLPRQAAVAIDTVDLDNLPKVIGIARVASDNAAPWAPFLAAAERQATLIDLLDPPR